MRLKVEAKRLRPLRVTPKEYALRIPVVAAPTGFVEHQGVRYGIPDAIGVPGTLYLGRDWVRIVADSHERRLPRYPEVGRDVILPADRDALVGAVRGKRGKFYSMRQQVLDLGNDAVDYLTEIRHRRPRTWGGASSSSSTKRSSSGALDLSWRRSGWRPSRDLFGAEYVRGALKEVAA